MNAHRKTAILVGAFFILSTLTGVLSVFAYGDSLDGANYLTKIIENQTMVVIGSILELICAGAFVLVSICTYPVFSLFSKRVAIGYVVGRSFEAIPFIISVITILAAISIGQSSAQASSLQLPAYIASGEVLQSMRYWANMYGPLVFCGLAALPFYTLLVRTKLVPGWLAIWGLVATFPYLAAGIASLFGFSTTSTAGIMMITPFAINEMVLAVWLIVKGFNSTALEMKS